MRSKLENIREWADAKIASGQEPPWAWFQYMKLRETLDAILAGVDSVELVDAVLSPESHEPEGRPAGRFRLIDGGQS